MTDQRPTEGITERRFTIRKKQAVTVDGKYGYLWGGEKLLQVGERVVLPGEWIGTVTDLGSIYSGYHASIIERAKDVS